MIVLHNSVRGNQLTTGRSYNPTRVVILSDQRESKGPSRRLPRRNTRPARFLIANDNPTRIVTLSDQRESKGLSFRFRLGHQHLQLLIANLELENRLTAIRISELKFSNREFSQLFQSLWRIAAGSQASRSRRSNSNIRITEKELSCTKQERKPNSNRNKIAFSSNSASHDFWRERSVSEPLSCAPNLAIIDFPVRGHL